MGRTIGGGVETNREAVHNKVIQAVNNGELTILDDVENAEEKGLLLPSHQ